MNILLVRVGADSSRGGGFWNGPVNSETNEFVYVPIPETQALRPGMEKPYADLAPALSKLGAELPLHLRSQNMHLDPDFSYLTYGDVRERAKQIRAELSDGGMIVFYAGLTDMRVNRRARQLLYAIIGIFDVDAVLPANVLSASAWDTNAHTRRILPHGATDLIVRARPSTSGRLDRCIPIGEFRDKAYRVRSDLLKKWGGVSNKNGYLQRSARLPKLLRPDLFLKWLDQQKSNLLQKNN